MTKRGEQAVKRPYRRNISRLRRTQGSLTDCVAYYFNLHPEHVPFFSLPRSHWKRRLKAFFRRRGYQVRWRSVATPPKRGTVIVCGDSLRWKTFSHVVVYRNGRLAYDPQFPSKWSEDRITHALIVEVQP